MNLEEFKGKKAELVRRGLAKAKAGKLNEAEALKAQIEDLETKFAVEKVKKAEENALKEKATVNAVVNNSIKLGEENKRMEKKIYDASSNEYKNAFLKSMLGRELNELENAAYTHTTGNTSAVLPTTMVNEIWDLVSAQNAILGDVTVYRTGTILEVSKHTEIAQGKATKKGEGVANDDEKNTFVKVTLSGNDFVKHVYVSYAEAQMSIEAFETYLTNEIANGIGSAMADDLVTTIESGINATNVISASKTLDYASVLKAFGALKRVGETKVYCTRATLYTLIAGIQDGAGQYIFQPSAVPGLAGSLLGAEVKIEDAVADNTILIGDPKKVVYNMVQDIMVETDKDIVTHKFVYSGYARGEGALIDDKAFAQINVTTA